MRRRPSFDRGPELTGWLGRSGSPVRATELGSGPVALSRARTPRRLSRDRRARVPYSYAAVVLLLVLVVLVSSILTGDFTGSAGHQPGLPTDLQYVLSSLAESIEAQAINLTVTQAAQEISSQGTFAFSSLNAPVQAAFQNYLQAIFLENSTYCRNGDPVGPYVVCLTAYTMNVTQPPLQGQGFVPTFGGENGALNTSAVEVPFQVGITTESPFLGVEGVLDLEVFGGNGFLASGSYPFLQTTQVPLGLFDSSFNL